MKLHSKKPHSTLKYQHKEGVWIPYQLKNLRQVNLQEMRTTTIRNVIKMAGRDFKTY